MGTDAQMGERQYCKGVPMTPYALCAVCVLLVKL